ncbi:MAG: outer membrane protein assembly factor BamA [Deltaproteobacteria bacterium]|nr:outer membrane protein assembly factor BamA [Deltaproteobacteria bacterium]
MSIVLLPYPRRILIILLAVIAFTSTPFPLFAEEGSVKGIVSQMIIEPHDAISITELKALTGIGEGAPFSRKALKKGIKLLYLKGGFSDISVDAEESEGKIRLYFIFTLNERVGKVSFSGNRRISTRYLEDIVTIQEWDEFNLRSIQKQGAAIKDFYRKNGYFLCEVEFRELRFPNERRVGIEYIIREGKPSHLSRITFSGNKRFSEQRLLKELSLKIGKRCEEDAVAAAVKRLKKFYRQKGYLEAKVDFQPTHVHETNEVNVAIIILEGELKGKDTRIKKITFKGNSAISSKTLRKQMLTEKVFSEKIFSEDIGAIEFLYRKRGYLTARVTERSITYDEKGAVRIEISIVEGPKTIIKEIEVEGNYIFGRDELLKGTGLKAGIPLDPWRHEEVIRKISSLYFQKGYIYVRVYYKEEFNEDSSLVILRYRINEGIPVRIGKIVIRGNDFTEDKVIRRELLIKPGEIYNPEKVFKSQQRVYRLGYLSNVKLTQIDEDIMEEEKNLLLSVRDRKAGAFEFGVGYGSEEKFRGFAELSHRNLYGTGASARLRGDVSQLETSYVLGFKKPWFLDFPVDGRFSLVDQVTRRDSYSLEKYAAITGLDKDLTEFIKVSLQYEYEISRLFDVDEGAKISSEDEGTLDIGTISPIIIRDSRDNPFNPRTGSVNSFKLDYSAGMATASDIEFFRYIFQSSWYIPVSKSIVWGLSARGGWADAFGETTELPISKRFFLGGRTTVRGFELDSIGPKGADGSPTGGDAYLNLNTELRFPIYRSFGGLVFVDAGNVWLKSAESVNIADLRSSAGVGFRYQTPIGPLSLDAGWKLDRESGESAWEWHFTIGNVF